MHPDTMKHKASLWTGAFDSSQHITDVHWEGDITQAELMEVADQISADWQTIDLELDPTHPCHGRTYRLQKNTLSLEAEELALRTLEAEDTLEGQYVWVHCYQQVYDPAGDHVDDAGRPFRQVFSTLMFCTEFSTFDEIADQCDENFGPGEWDAYELYLDDHLPVPTATYVST